MTGDVRVKLVRGRAVVTGSRSPFALYDESLATYGNADRFKHDAATGFIEIWGLPIAAGADKAAEAAQRSTLVTR
jgi:argininosuccinate synthase